MKKINIELDFNEYNEFLKAKILKDTIMKTAFVCEIAEDNFSLGFIADSEIIKALFPNEYQRTLQTKINKNEEE